jgi:hypothetical protein
MFEASAGGVFAKSCRKAATHMPKAILIRKSKLPDPEVLVRTDPAPGDPMQTPELHCCLLHEAVTRMSSMCAKLF